MLYKFPKMERLKGSKHPRYSENDQWEAREKIHGANLSFYYSFKDDVVTPRSRSKTIGLDSYGDYSFFKASSKIKECSINVKHVSLAVKGLLDITFNPDAVIVYGELFGGGVQKEIKYSKQHRFVVFDIAVVYNDEVYWLNKVWVDIVCKGSFKTAPVIAKGTFEDVSNIDLNGTMSHLSDYGEFIEGVVISPRGTSLFAKEGFTSIKSLASNFLEHEYGTREIDKDLLEKVLEYVTPIRVAHIRGNYGDEIFNNFNRFFGCYLSDVYDDFLQDNTLYTKEDLRKLKKPLKNKIRDLYNIYLEDVGGS